MKKIIFLSFILVFLHTAFVYADVNVQGTYTAVLESGSVAEK